MHSKPLTEQSYVNPKTKIRFRTQLTEDKHAIYNTRTVCMFQKITYTYHTRTLQSSDGTVRVVATLSLKF